MQLCFTEYEILDGNSAPAFHVEELCFSCQQHLWSPCFIKFTTCYTCSKPVALSPTFTLGWNWRGQHWIYKYAFLLFFFIFFCPIKCWTGTDSQYSVPFPLLPRSALYFQEQKNTSLQFCPMFTWANLPSLPITHTATKFGFPVFSFFSISFNEVCMLWQTNDLQQKCCLVLKDLFQFLVRNQLWGAAMSLFCF